MQGTWELGGQCEPTGHDDACTVCTALHKSRALGQGTALALALENTGKALRGAWRALGGTARLLDSTGKALREPGRATSPAQMEALWRGTGALLHITKPRSRRAPEAPSDAQEPPKSARELPRRAQEVPSDAQEPPRAPKFCPRRAQKAPSDPQEPPRAPKSRPRRAQKAPSDAQEPPKTRPEGCKRRPRGSK